MAYAQPYQRLVDIAQYLVDSDCGIIQRISEIPHEAGNPDFYHFAGQSADTSAFVRQQNFNITGGASITRSGAIAKAIGEAVERYCSAVFDIEELPLLDYSAAPDQCVDPVLFDWYSEAQYELPEFLYLPFTQESPIRWTRATDLVDGQVFLVPACTVFLPYAYYQGSGDTPIVQPISTGLACHCSLAEASVGAICEVIERDAFTIAWQGMVEPPQILPESLSDRNYDLLTRFERCGGEVKIFDITTDTGVPTVLSVQRCDHPERAPLVFAASTELSPEKAVFKSLEELAHTGRYMQQIKTHLPRLNRDSGYDNVTDQLSHLNFWCDHANTHLAEFMFRSPERIDFEDMTDISTLSADGDLGALVDQITDSGHRILLAELTTLDLEELGLSVVRALIPGFHPLFMDHRYRSLGCRRRWEVPQRLGRRVAPECTELGNPAPHPYP